MLKIAPIFEDEIKNLKELKTGMVTVGATPHRGVLLFSEFLAEFYMKYPGITVKTVEAPTNELKELLLAGNVDFAMLREPVKKSTSSRFATMVFQRISLCICFLRGILHANMQSHMEIPAKWCWIRNGCQRRSFYSRTHH